MHDREDHPFREPPPPPAPARDPLRRLRLLPRMWAYVLTAVLGTQLARSHAHAHIGIGIAVVGFVGLVVTIRRIERE